MQVVNKNNVLHAVRWFRNGDHPDDRNIGHEGAIVRYFNHPFVRGNDKCPECDTAMQSHGWIDFGLVGLENTTVCPGDWIIYSGDQGFACVNNNDFKKLYLKVIVDDYDPGKALDTLLGDGKTKVPLY